MTLKDLLKEHTDNDGRLDSCGCILLISVIYKIFNSVLDIEVNKKGD